MASLTQIDEAASASAATSFQRVLAGSGVVAASGDDLIVVAFASSTTVAAAGNLTDSQGHTWTLDNMTHDTFHRGGVWRTRLTADMVGGTDWVQFAAAGTDWRSIRVIRIVNGGQASPTVDVVVASTGQASGTAVATGTTAATAQNDEFVLVIYIANGAVTYSAFPGGYTQLGTALAPNSLFTTASAFKQVSATGTQTGNNATITPAAAKGGGVTTYKISLGTTYTPATGIMEMRGEIIAEWTEDSVLTSNRALQTGIGIGI